ncbi:MAG: hypothetical protein DRQ65_06635 [Gammaproteobacteria bacterium]|nr:MAG: hypothetical protein DRQ61_07140 [Gammaproteobacteria bacterium]RLA52808.1 MAG: hypothetical protein DRQ65_06635 [Gammaproteobacteria bacterium]
MDNVLNLFGETREYTPKVTPEYLADDENLVRTYYEILFSIRSHYIDREPNHELRDYIGKVIAESLLEGREDAICTLKTYNLFLDVVKPATQASLNKLLGD